jgi:tetratricopeptide (TPR) repeat protein
MTPEMIAAIAGLWKLVAALAILILPIIFRRSLIDSVGRLKTFQLKRDKVELAAELTSTKLVKETEVGEFSTSEAQAETKLLEGVSVEIPVKQLTKLESKDSDDLIKAMFDAAFVSRSKTEVEEIFKKLQEVAKDEEEKFGNEAIYYFLRYDLGDIEAISKLQEMTKVERAAAYAHKALGFCYNDSGDYEKAAMFFTLAAQGYRKKGSVKEHQVIDSVLRAADCLSKIGSQQDAYIIITSEIAVTVNQLFLSDLYSGLASLYEQAGDVDFRAITLEKAVEYKPNDIKLRFSVGWTYGNQKSTHALSLLHYKTLLQFDEAHASALNNIAVQYGRLKMPLTSVPFYKKSASLNETLAAGNLANMYINAGFGEDARQLLDTAKQQPTIDPKIGEEIAHLSKKERRRQKVRKHN